MRTLRGTLATRGILIAIGALIAIAASAVTAVAVRAGAAGGAAASQAAVGAGSVAGPRDTVTVVGEGTQNATPDNAEISLGVSVTRGNSGDALNAANTEMTALVRRSRRKVSRTSTSRPPGSPSTSRRRSTARSSIRRGTRSASRSIIFPTWAPSSPPRSARSGTTSS